MEIFSGRKLQTWTHFTILFIYFVGYSHLHILIHNGYDFSLTDFHFVHQSLYIKSLSVSVCTCLCMCHQNAQTSSNAWYFSLKSLSASLHWFKPLKQCAREGVCVCVCVPLFVSHTGEWGGGDTIKAVTFVPTIFSPYSSVYVHVCQSVRKRSQYASSVASVLSVSAPAAGSSHLYKPHPLPVCQYKAWSPLSQTLTAWTLQEHSSTSSSSPGPRQLLQVRMKN